MTHLKYEIKQIPAYRAMGLRGDISFQHIEAIADLIHTSITRVDELQYVVNKEVRLGLSYHLRPDGFTYYSVYEVQKSQPLLEGMVDIHVPEMTYFVTSHQGGSVEATYQQIMEWFKESEYIPLREEGITYFDELPIKHDIHHRTSNPNDPHFEIRIPITKP
ncbi:GyrI-like domain-containing protein [Gracilibacillus alcaliphilus]|uniref:GyrI-like domain-containing protein n=1 Tax=Gracilibacillus alcaliphilus TaxID=1401441 RepID=UPI00195D084F|nr:GyrI-like domain-containing protein [Gracilibacillus alcaliphilus]MBM7679164.1 putative transcriptional regulator YdeE [Gracilibacillus alcaliphilus]